MVYILMPGVVLGKYASGWGLLFEGLSKEQADNPRSLLDRGNAILDHSLIKIGGLRSCELDEESDLYDVLFDLSGSGDLYLNCNAFDGREIVRFEGCVEIN